MKPETGIALLVVAILLFFGGVIGMGIGSYTQHNDDDRRWQADATKRGYGEFVITDSTNGATQFQWRRP